MTRWKVRPSYLFCALCFIEVSGFKLELPRRRINHTLSVLGASKELPFLGNKSYSPSVHSNLVKTGKRQNKNRTHDKIRTNIEIKESGEEINTSTGTEHKQIRRRNKCDPHSKLKFKFLGRHERHGRAVDDPGDFYYDYEDGKRVEVEEVKKETVWEKFAKNWQKAALIGIFGLAFVFCVCGCCCYSIITLVKRLSKNCCAILTELVDMCRCRDAAYRKARRLASQFGVKLEYSQYKKMKSAFGHGAEDK